MRVLFYWQERMHCAEIDHIAYTENLYDIDEEDTDNKLTEGLEFYEPDGELYVMETTKIIAERILGEVTAKGYINLCGYLYNGQSVNTEIRWFNAEKEVFE